MLEMYRGLISLRRDLRGPVEAEVAGAALLLRRGVHTVVLNLGETELPAQGLGRPILSTGSARAGAGSIAPGEGSIFVKE